MSILSLPIRFVDHLRDLEMPTHFAILIYHLHDSNDSPNRANEARPNEKWNKDIYVALTVAKQNEIDNDYQDE